jgi:hypothetical protein
VAKDSGATNLTPCDKEALIIDHNVIELGQAGFNHLTVHMKVSLSALLTFNFFLWRRCPDSLARAQPYIETPTT